MSGVVVDFPYNVMKCLVHCWYKVTLIILLTKQISSQQTVQYHYLTIKHAGRHTHIQYYFFVSIIFI
jgi:hypothetical protein